jgi:hypothetical protein
VAVDDNSRYANTGTYIGTDTNGRQVEGFELRPVPTTTGFFYFTPSGADRLDLIANTFYHDPRKFWRICDASDQLDPFDVIAPNVPILLPENR